MGKFTENPVGGGGFTIFFVVSDKLGWTRPYRRNKSSELIHENYLKSSTDLIVAPINSRNLSRGWCHCWQVKLGKHLSISNYTQNILNFRVKNWDLGVSAIVRKAIFMPSHPQIANFTLSTSSFLSIITYWQMELSLNLSPMDDAIAPPPQQN